MDDLGRILTPKETRVTFRIREGDFLLTMLTGWQSFRFAMPDLSKRNRWDGIF